MRRVGVIWMCLFVLSGCWRPNRVENGFPAAIRTWRQAVLHDQPRRAYELLDDETRQKLPYPRFEQEWKANRAEMLHEARRMNPEKARMTAVIRLGKSDSATLVSQKPGVWKVEDAPGLRPSTPSPEALLRGMAGALKRRDWPEYLSLMTPEYRHAVEEDMNNKILMFEKAAENLPAGDTGSILRVPLDASGVLVLVLRRVHGAWRVDGFETARGGKAK